MPTDSSSSLRRPWYSLLPAFALVCAVQALPAAEARKPFDLPAGRATETLKQFATQAGREIVFSTDSVGTVDRKSVV